MRPHLILEGPDCSGKTTIANHLVNEWGYRYQHEGPPPPDIDIFTYYAGKLQTTAWAQVPVVFDRMYLGETIYGPLLRGESKLTPQHLLLLARLCRARGIYRVLCGPSYRVSLAAWSARKQTELIKDEAIFERIYQAYQKSAYEFRVSTMVMPRHMFDFEALTLPAPYVGSPTAKFLFVGDQPNGGHLDLAFMAIENSSGFLNRCLLAAGFRESEIALVNARSLSGDENKLKQFPVVVALGEEAAKVCQSQGIHGRRIPHPAFWRRFHSQEEGAYFALLRKIKNDNRGR